MIILGLHQYHWLDLLCVNGLIVLTVYLALSLFIEFEVWWAAALLSWVVAVLVGYVQKRRKVRP